MKLRSLALMGAALLLTLPAAAFAQTNTPTPAPTIAITLPESLDFAALIADAPTLEVGGSVTDELGGDVQALGYVFEAEAGARITATLVSEIFDTYLVLVDADGVELDTDDDSAGSLDSQISGYEIPVSGTYGLIATSFGGYRGTGSAEGEFTLSLGAFETRLVEYSQRIDGELTTAQTSIEYRFTGTAGDAVTIFMGAEDFDCYLYLYDEDGIELVRNDDGGGNLDSLIGPYTLPYTGEYVIRASSFSGSATGSFFLTLDRTESFPIAFGDTVELDLEGGSTVYLTFDANLGDIVSVIVDGEVDTSLSLRDTYGYNALTDTDSGSRFNPEITDYVVSTGGSYSLLLTSEGGSGAVSVTLERSELPSLDDGPQSVFFSDTVQTRAIAFTAEAGVEYEISFDVVGGSSSPSFDVRYGEFSSSYFSTTNVTGGTLRFVADTSGDAVITVSDYSYASTEIVLTLAVVE